LKMVENSIENGSIGNGGVPNVSYRRLLIPVEM